MGYVVRKLPHKSRTWKVIYQDRVGGAMKTRDVRTHEYLTLGVRLDMTYTEVKQRVDQINTRDKLDRRERSRVEIQKRLEAEADTQTAYLPPQDLAEFEANYLQTRSYNLKMRSHWAAAKRVLCALKIPPEDWEHRKSSFYSYWANKCVSPSYVQKVLPLLNLWGGYQARKYKFYFKDLPGPTGKDRERIADAYFKKVEEGYASDPLTPENLQANIKHFSSEQGAWLSLSVWFGLRPKEVDQLRQPAGAWTWTLKSEGKIPYIQLFQTKLTGIPRAERYKNIPCLRDEQVALITLLGTNGIKRPLCKTVRKYLGDRITLYGGRKGFTDLMLSFGYELEVISAWMGHRSIQMTWAKYKGKKKVLLPAA